MHVRKGIRPHAYATYDEMSAAVADRVIQVIREKQKKGEQPVIGLATGSTPEGVYKEICRRKELDPTLDFSNVTFFALDEYVGVPKESKDSYHHYLWSKLLGPIGADPAKVHIPDGMSEDLQNACQAYEDQLKKAGKVDLWIVGIGPNGHIAFNEPGSPLKSRTRKVELTQETLDANRQHFDPGTSLPTHAVTVGLGTIKEYAKEVAFLVRGEHRRDILHKVFEMHGVTSAVPATILKTMNTNAYFDTNAYDYGYKISQSRRRA